MNQVHKRSRVLGSLFLATALVLAACDAPMAPTASEPALLDAAPVAFAKKLDVQPPATPQCPTPFGDGRVLCFADVNTKHGNASGLPVNLTGVVNGKGNSATLTVSVLGTLEFDLSAVDLSSLRLGDARTNPPETPLTVLNGGKYQASIVDLNGDGILDLMLHFDLATMVAKADISATTTELCLYGEGPGYVLNGCGIGGGDGGDGDGDGDDEEPPVTLPDYRTLTSCDFASSPKTGQRCAFIRQYGRYTEVNVRALVFGGFTESTGFLDAEQVYPGWLTSGVKALQGKSVLASPPSYEWATVKLPLGQDNSVEPGFCPVTSVAQSGLNWPNKWQVLVREDLPIPTEARNVRIEFLVDDVARVYANGELVADWSFSGDDFACADYGRTRVVSIPDRFLARDGMNKLAVWAEDGTGGANFLDFRVFADVPIS